MLLKNRIFLLSIISSLVAWFIFAELEYSLFYKENSFDLFNLKTAYREIYIIFVVIVVAAILAWFLSLSINELNEAKNKNKILSKELYNSLADNKRLSGLLPICSSCKKIRDDHGCWNKIEYYIEEHSEAEFTHGICPECANKFYPE